MSPNDNPISSLPPWGDGSSDIENESPSNNNNNNWSCGKRSVDNNDSFDDKVGKKRKGNADEDYIPEEENPDDDLIADKLSADDTELTRPRQMPRPRQIIGDKYDRQGAETLSYFHNITAPHITTRVELDSPAMEKREQQRKQRHDNQEPADAPTALATSIAPTSPTALATSMALTSPTALATSMAPTALTAPTAFTSQTDEWNIYIQRISDEGDDIRRMSLEEMRSRPPVWTDEEKLGMKMGLVCANPDNGGQRRPLRVRIHKDDYGRGTHLIYRNPIASSRHLYEFSKEKAMSYCGVGFDSVSLDLHDQDAKDLALSLGFPTEFAIAAYKHDRSNSCSIYLTGSNKLVNGIAAIDLYERNGDETILAMGYTQVALKLIMGGDANELAKACGDLLNGLLNGSAESVDIGELTLTKHDPTTPFVPGVVEGMEERVNRLKRTKARQAERYAEERSAGKYAISLASPYEQNEPFWDRQEDEEDEEDEDGRRMFRYKTHAISGKAVTQLVKTRRISKDLSRVAETGTSFQYEVTRNSRAGMIFTIEKFDSNTHGTFDCWKARMKRADQSGSN